MYRLLKAHDLITSPAYILIEAADKFRHPTTRVNELWQTDFTYCKGPRRTCSMDGGHRGVYPGPRPLTIA